MPLSKRFFPAKVWLRSNVPSYTAATPRRQSEVPAQHRHIIWINWPITTLGGRNGRIVNGLWLWRHSDIDYSSEGSTRLAGERRVGTMILILVAFENIYPKKMSLTPLFRFRGLVRLQKWSTHNYSRRFNPHQTTNRPRNPIENPWHSFQTSEFRTLQNRCGRWDSCQNRG